MRDILFEVTCGEKEGAHGYRLAQWAVVIVSADVWVYFRQNESFTSTHFLLSHCSSYFQSQVKTLVVCLWWTDVQKLTLLNWKVTEMGCFLPIYTLFNSITVNIQLNWMLAVMSMYEHRTWGTVWSNLSLNLRVLYYIKQPPWKAPNKLYNFSSE